MPEALEGAHPRSAAGDGPRRETSRATKNPDTMSGPCRSTSGRRTQTGGEEQKGGRTRPTERSTLAKRPRGAFLWRRPELSPERRESSPLGATRSTRAGKQRWPERNHRRRLYQHSRSGLAIGSARGNPPHEPQVGNRSNVASTTCNPRRASPICKNGTAKSH